MEAEELRNAIVNMAMFMDEIKMAEHNCDVHENQEACDSVGRLIDGYTRSRDNLYEVLSKCQK